MYLSSGSKKIFDVPSARDLVDLAVGRGGDVEAAARRRRDRVHLELGGVEERRHLAVAADLGAPCPRCRCRPTACRRASATTVHRNGAAVSAETDAVGPEEDAAVAVDRQVLDVALEEIGLGRDASRTWASRAEQADATRGTATSGIADARRRAGRSRTICAWM